MKRLFEISSEEKKRILEMHESATKRNYLNEQNPQPQSSTAASVEPEGVEINGTTYKLTNAVGRDNTSLTTFLNYNPDARFMGTFCLTPGLQCGGMNNVSFKPLADGKPSNWTMMKEFAKMYLNEVAKSYGNKIIPTACSDSPGPVVLYENIEPKIKPAFLQKYGLDDKKYEEFSKYFGTIAKYKTGLQSALRTQLNLVGACKAKPNPEQRSSVGKG